ncbi:tripartite motif-containing protein 16 [Myxocyprinus asiaticus]|uniref:tripartite motif-containing protein 16 n=1 Tax=Myxocyprinus asiaticus TaxID=70543 RepID=UPI002222D80A|nr:tripartite motif-containing protein 16 [Myxocyprinus asiaticus]
MEDQQDPRICSVCLQDLQENSCPQCQQTSTSGTDQDESIASVAESLERTRLQRDTSVDVQAETGDVECDSCTVNRGKAIKSCLVCLASYCDTHLRIHNDLNAGKTHCLVEVTGHLQGKMCSKHEKLLEVLCRTDQQCICYLCMLDDHKGHDVVSVAIGREEKQRQLEKSKQKLTARENELKEMKNVANVLRDLSQATEEEGDRIFTELLSFIRRSHTEMIELIQTQMTNEMDRIHGHMEGLEQEISKLKRKQSEQEQLSHTDDHIHFLQEVQSRWPNSQSEDFPILTANPQFSFGEVIKSLLSLTAQTEGIWTLEISRICSAVKTEKILLPSEPKMREDFLQFLVPLSLDPNTAHRNLCLSEQNQAVACSDEPQPYPEHPDRFEWWAQVLSKEGLTGRHYWEATWSGQYGVDIAVTYKDINRTGQDDASGFGFNRHSWSLDCSIFRYALVHDNLETEIAVPLSHRIGVYLDYRAGLLSFYSVSDSMILLHRAQTRFTQPLYPGFGLFQGSTAKFCGPDKEASTQATERRLYLQRSKLHLQTRRIHSQKTKNVTKICFTPNDSKIITAARGKQRKI